MRDLFAIQPSNSHSVLLANDYPAWKLLTESLHWVSLSEGWREPELHWHLDERRTMMVADISVAYMSGVIAFRRELQDDLLPTRRGLEVLPVKVDTQPWLLINCLNSIETFDEERSSVFRGLTGQIFMTSRLEINAEPDDVPELFTLAESNRANLFAQTSFKARVEQLQLKGLTFRPIGSIG